MDSVYSPSAITGLLTVGMGASGHFVMPGRAMNRMAAAMAFLSATMFSMIRLRWRALLRSPAKRRSRLMRWRGAGRGMQAGGVRSSGGLVSRRRGGCLVR